VTRWGFLAAALLAIAGCAQPEPRYVVGDPYRLGGVWSYPQEDYALSETGLSEVLPAPMFGGQTANGEVLMAQGLTAAPLFASPIWKMAVRCCCASMIAARKSLGASWAYHRAPRPCLA
jgi:hypothetical protein